MKRLNGFAEALDYIEQRNQIVIQDDEVVSRTREIVSDVRRRGDDALHHYT